MANYKETTITGNTWIRCYNISISNPIPQEPTIMQVAEGAPPVIRSSKEVARAVFHEERVLALEGQDSSTQVGYCSKDVDLVNGIFSLRDPETGELTGQSMTHLELYKILYSLYIQTALERDAAQAV